MNRFIMSVLLILLFNQACAKGYEYKRDAKNKHVLHILKIEPAYYVAKLVKANNGKIGRKTVSSLAEQQGAKLAINAGFFEIGGEIDGQPSGTLIVKGKVYNKIDKVHPLVVINSGKISIELANPSVNKNKNLSMVSGLPMLVYKGEIPEGLAGFKSNFYSNAHARTAIGVDCDGKIIIVVAEHYYSRDGLDFTMGELNSLMRQKGIEFAQRYHKKDPGELTLKELREILKSEFTESGKTQGLTIIDLAQMMKSLGCLFALNLDGGGSSTLWIDGRVVNSAIGDADEGDGKAITRSVSDAIIFVKKGR